MHIYLHKLCELAYTSLGESRKALPKVKKEREQRTEKTEKEQREENRENRGEQNWRFFCSLCFNMYYVCICLLLHTQDYNKSMKVLWRIDMYNVHICSALLDLLGLTWLDLPWLCLTWLDRLRMEIDCIEILVARGCTSIHLPSPRTSYVSRFLCHWYILHGGD